MKTFILLIDWENSLLIIFEWAQPFNVYSKIFCEGFSNVKKITKHILTNKNMCDVF